MRRLDSRSRERRRSILTRCGGYKQQIRPQASAHKEVTTCAGFWKGGVKLRDWLKEKRTAKGLTMAAMAEKLDLTESYYSLIEAGKRQQKMDIVLVGKLSAVLSIPVAEIVELEAM